MVPIESLVPVLSTMLMFLVTGGAMTLVHRRHRRQAQNWMEVGRELGLEYKAARMFCHNSLVGRKGRAQVEVKSISRGKHGRFTVYRFSGGIPEELTIGKDNRIRTLLGGPDLRFDDERFDADVRVTGDLAWLSAVLDERGREIVRTQVLEGVRVERGEVRLTERGVADQPTLRRRIAALRELCEALAPQPVEIAARLAENASREPVAASRLRNLRLLQERYSSSAVARQASLRALTDPDPGVRLQGALGAKAEGLPVLIEVARREDAPSLVRSRAVRELATRLPRAEAIPVLEPLVGQAPTPVAIAAAAALGELGSGESLGPVLTLARGLGSSSGAGDPGGESASEVARALGGIGNPGAESLLVEWLGRGEDLVRAAAARALGRCGTLGAVEPLLVIRQQLLQPAAVRRAAEESAGAIQARLGHREPGGLTLVAGTTEAGGLSLLDPAAPGGAVSLSAAAPPEPDLRVAPESASETTSGRSGASAPVGPADKRTA